MERPTMFSRNHVKAPNILFEARHDHYMLENGRSRRRRAEISLCPARERPLAINPETANRFPGSWIQSIEIFTCAKQNSLGGVGLSRPINQPPECRPAFGPEAPQLHASLSVYGDHKLGRCGSEHNTVHNDGVALNIVARIERVIGPGDLEIGNVLPINLVERRVARAAVVAMRSVPGKECLALRTTVCGRQFFGPGGRNDLVQRQLFSGNSIFDCPIIHSVIWGFRRMRFRFRSGILAAQLSG